MDTPPPYRSIGTLSKRTGCKVETIRYYEKAGLMPPPLRSAGGHRQYDEASVQRLNFILRARGLGFPLETVRVLLELADGERESCAEVERIAALRLADVRTKIEDLKVLDAVLSEMVSQCRRGDLPECPLIEALFEGPLRRNPAGGWK